MLVPPWALNSPVSTVSSTPGCLALVYVTAQRPVFYPSAGVMETLIFGSLKPSEHCQCHGPSRSVFCHVVLPLPGLFALLMWGGGGTGVASVPPRPSSGPWSCLGGSSPPGQLVSSAQHSSRSPFAQGNTYSTDLKEQFRASIEQLNCS